MDSSLAFESHENLVKEVKDKRSKDQKSFQNNSTSGVFSESTTALSDSKNLDNYSLCSESDWSDEKKDCSDADSGPATRDRVKEVRTKADITEESRTDETRTVAYKAEGRRTDETRIEVNETAGSRTDETRTEVNETTTEGSRAKLNGTMQLGNHDPERIEGRDKQGSTVESSTPDAMLSVEESEEGRSSRSKLLTGISPMTVSGDHGSQSILVTGIDSPIKKLTCI